MRAPRTEQETWRWLKEYEDANDDIPLAPRRHLALFSLASKNTVPNHIVMSLLGYESTSLHRDISRRWWMVLYYSEQSKHWQQFKLRAEETGVNLAWGWLVAHVSREDRKLIERRLGSTPKTSGQGTDFMSGNLWFKAGTWWKGNAWTQMLILREDMDDRRQYLGRAWEQKLKPHLRTLELECAVRIDPDKVSPGEARYRTVAFLRVRMAELVGWKKQQASGIMIAWFMTAHILMSQKLWPWKVYGGARGGVRKRQGLPAERRRWA